MKRLWILSLALAVVLTAVGAPVSGKNYSEWSEPTKIDQLNTPYMDSCPAFTKDGLSLYFVSYDPMTGTGKRDLYVSQWASVDQTWGVPQKLGDNINTVPNEERCPYVTPDGRRLIFVRQIPTLPGAPTLDDFYMSTRRDKKDDFGWGDPVKITALSGPGMDTAGWGFEDETGNLTFYFGSNRAGTHDIYQTTMDSDGSFTPPVLVTELSDPAAVDYFPVVRKDGLEMYLISNRIGTVGGTDIWVSTRNSTSDPWSTPVNLGPAVNSSANEWRAALSWDGMDMIFVSNSEDSANYDLYKSQRTKVKGQLPNYTFTTIDPPRVGTFAVACDISPGGEIVGNYVSVDSKWHGFVLRGGEFTVLDHPADDVTYIQPRGIAPSGDITGLYVAAGKNYGFVLSRKGEWSTVDYPGHLNTWCNRILPDGTLVGSYFDTPNPVPSESLHGWVWGGEGPSDTGIVCSTVHSATPDGKVLVGVHRPAPYTAAAPQRGYVIDEGVFTSFSFPGSQHTLAWDVSPDGNTIVGAYINPDGATHGYVVERRGTSVADWGFITIDAPDATLTSIIGCNPAGDLVGTYKDAIGNQHGFLASRSGGK